MRKIVYSGAYARLGALLIASTAHAQQEINLTVAAGQPLRAMRPLQMVSDFYIPEVEKRIKAANLNIKINWKEAYAGSLLKPTFVLKGVQDGIADIGFEPTIFHPDKLPLEQISFMTPFATSDVVHGRQGDRQAARHVPGIPGAVRQVRRDPARRIELRLLRAVQHLPGAEVRRHQGQEDLDRRRGAAMDARHAARRRCRAT